MTQCLSGQIELLEQQIELYTREPGTDASAMLAYDLEEMMSVYVSLFNELEKAVKRTSPRQSWNQAAVEEWLPMYDRYVHVGELLRDAAKSLKAGGDVIEGLDEFMQTFILARAGAGSSHDSIALCKAVAGESGTRPLRESCLRRDHVANV